MGGQDATPSQCRLACGLLMGRQDATPSQCRLACGLLMGGQDATPSQCRLADGDVVMITEKVNRFLIRMCRYILNERKVRGFG